MWLRAVDSKKFCAQRALFRAVRCNALPLLTAASARYSSCLSWLGFSFSSCRLELGVVLWLFYLSLLFFSLFLQGSSPHSAPPIPAMQPARLPRQQNMTNHTHTHTHTHTHIRQKLWRLRELKEEKEIVSFRMSLLEHVRPSRPISFFSISYCHHPGFHLLMLLFIWNKLPKTESLESWDIT